MKAFWRCLSVVLDASLIVFSIINILIGNSSWYDYFILIGNCILVLPATVLQARRNRRTEQSENHKSSLGECNNDKL